MGFSVRPRTKATRSGRVTVPDLVVRMIEPDDVVSNSNTGRVGEIRPDLIPISLSFSPGPQGSILEIQHPEEVWYSGGRDNDADLEDLEGKILTLEMRKSISTLSLQRVLFRGLRSDEGGTWDASPADARTSSWSDWMIFDGAPLSIPRPDRWVAGSIFQGFEDGYLQIGSVVAGHPVLTTVILDPYPLPITHDGTPLAKISDDLKALVNRIGYTNLTDTQFSQGFCDLCESVNRIPSLGYSGGFWLLEANTPGFEERDLIIGADGLQLAQGNATLDPNASRLNGNANHRNRFSAIIGRGGKEYSIEPVELEPGWSGSEEFAVIANPTLAGTPAYEHVARRFFLPNRVRFIGPNVAAFRDDGAGSNQPRVWTGINSSNLLISDVNWRPIYDKAEGVNDTILTESDDENGERTPTGILFETPIWNLDATNVITGIKVAQMEALRITGNLTVYSESEDDTSYFRRVKIFNNPGAEKVNWVSHYTLNTTTGGKTNASAATTSMTRDDSGNLQIQVDDFLDRVSNPDQNKDFNVGYFDPTWRLGTKITRILDTRGNVLESGLSIYCYGGRHEFTGKMNTQVRLSMEFQRLLSGRIQGG